MDLNRFIDYLSELDEVWLINNTGEIRSLRDKCPLVAATERSELFNNDYLIAAELLNISSHDAMDIVYAADHADAGELKSEMLNYEFLREQLLIACKLASRLGDN